MAAAPVQLDLPQPWMLKLAQCKGLDASALLALFRTCTTLRDAVLCHRTAIAGFRVPIAAEDFAAQVERLSTVARRSSNVRLEFAGKENVRGRPKHRWTRTEPCIAHLLVCAMAQLEGEQPLACVKEVFMEDLEQSSLVPAWVKVLCPNATKFGPSTLAHQPLCQPRPHQHLQELAWGREWDADEDPPVAEHVRQQLAALPSLTSLTAEHLGWAEEEDEQQAGRLISSTVTRLELTYEDDWEDSSRMLRRLPTQFPNLRELHAPRCITVDDGRLEALLRLPHLERLSVWSFELQVSHTQRGKPWTQLGAHELDVDSFARLPLDSIHASNGWGEVYPSADAAAVARVAEAIRRWGGRGNGGGSLMLYSHDVAALLTTLGPLLAALPAEQQQQVTIYGLRDATPQQVQQLGQQLPPGVTTLCLQTFTVAPEAWAALLPGLPATVEELRLEYPYPPPTEQQVLALCRGAVRPIRVKMRRRLTDEQWGRLCREVAGLGQPGRWVALVDE